MHARRSTIGLTADASLAVRQKRTAGNVYFRKKENVEHSHICISRVSRMDVCLFVHLQTPENFSHIIFITSITISTHIASLNHGFHVNYFFWCTKLIQVKQNRMLAYNFLYSIRQAIFTLSFA